MEAKRLTLVNQKMQIKLHTIANTLGFFLALFLLSAGSATEAANLYKADNSTALNQAASWTNNAVPGITDTAIWDSNVATAVNATNVLGGGLTWTTLTVSNPAAPVQISADGNTLTLTNLNLYGNNLTLNCGLTVGGSPTWNMAGDQLTIGSAVGGPGNITQNQGTLFLAPGAGSLPSGMTYSFSGISKLDLGGNSQTLLNLGPAPAARSTITNGNLTLSLSSGDFNPATTGPNTILDLSGLSSFTVNNTNRNFIYSMSGTAAGTMYLYLATNGAGSNFLAVNELYPGAANSSVTTGTGPLTYMYLGAANVINAGTIQVTGYRDSGSMLFNSGLVNPTVKIRGMDGVSALPSWIIGNLSSGNYSEGATCDFTGGTIDCVVSNLVVGVHAAGAVITITAVLNIDGAASSVYATNILVGQKTGTCGGGTPTAKATVNQLNGSVTVSNLTLGDNKTSSSTGFNMQSAYNLVNGTLRAQTIQSGAVHAGETAACFRKILWSNGVIQDHDASTALTMTGAYIAAPGAGTRFFTVDANLTNSIQVTISQTNASAAPIIKNGPGTLDLAGATDNPWLSLNVSNGVVLLDKASSTTPSVHAIGYNFFINGGTVRLGLAGSGGDQIADSAVGYFTSGTFDLNSQSETIGGLSGAGGSVTDTSGGAGTLSLNVASGASFAFGGTFNNTFNLTMSGPGKQTFYGTDSRTSAYDTVNQGIFEIGNGGVSGTLASSVTVNTGGTLSFNRSGTLNFGGFISGAGNVAQNGPGILILSSDWHSGSTLANTGTLALPSGATSVSGSIVTVQSGAIFDVTAGGGNFAVGYNQVLNGTGTVQGGFYVGSGGTLSGDLTINGSVTAADGSTNNPGAFLAPGTITVNGSFTNTGNNSWVYNLAGVTNAGGGINALLVVTGNLDLGNPNNANSPTLIITGTPVSGRYTLATFGSFSGNAGNLVVVGSARYVFTSRVVGNALVLDITGNGGNLVWRGDGINNSWDTNPSNTDWFNIGSSSFDAFNVGDYATFNDTSSNSMVNINGSVQPALLTVNATSNYTFAYSGGSIDGPIGLTKTNSGTLTIQNANTFSGPVNLNGGTISVASVALNGSASPLGSGTTLAFNGGTLQYTGPALDGSSFNRQITLGPNGGFIDQESSSGVYLFITNLISGAGSLTKTGPQQVIIGDVGGRTGNNAYSGITYVNDGQLQLRHTNALGSAAGKTVVTAPGNVAAGGGLQGSILEPFDLSGDGDGNGALQAVDSGTAVSYAGHINLVGEAGVGGNVDFTISGNIGGTGPLTKQSGTTVSLLGTNTFTGGIVVSNGTLALYLANQAAGAPLTGGTVVSSGTLQLANGTANVTLPGWITNNGTLSVLVSSNTSVVMPGPIHGTGQLVENNLGGNLWLTGTNDFTGEVNVNAGALWINNSSALGAGPSQVQLWNWSAGQCALHLMGTNGSIVLGTNISYDTSGNVVFNEAGSNSLLGTITMAMGGGDSSFVANAGTLTLGGIVGASVSNRRFLLGGAANGVFSGTMVDTFGAPPRELLMRGAGTWTVTGTNTSAAAANVSSGTLLIDGEWAGPANAETGGTLGGTGDVLGAVTVQAGATLSPGVSVGTFTVNSNLTIAGNLCIKLNKSLAQSNDYVVVTGTLTNAGTGTVTVTNLGPALVAGDTFTLFSQPVANGNALRIASAPGITWTNTLAVYGSISVVSVAPPVNTTPTNLTYSVNGSALTLAWPANQTGWRLLVQTNHLSAGVSTNHADWGTVPNSTNVNEITITIDPSKPTEFYRLVYP